MKFLWILALAGFGGPAVAEDVVGTIAWYECTDGQQEYQANVRQNFGDWKPYYLELRPLDHAPSKGFGFDLQPHEYSAEGIGYDKKGHLLRKGVLKVDAPDAHLDLKLDCEYSEELNSKGEPRIPSSAKAKQKKK